MSKQFTIKDEGLSKVLDNLKTANKEYLDASQSVYTLFGNCDGDYNTSIDKVVQTAYDTLELLGFNGNELYDWVVQDEFLVFCDSLIYNLHKAEDYVAYTLGVKDLSEFTPCGEYTENEDGTINKQTRYGE